LQRFGAVVLLPREGGRICGDCLEEAVEAMDASGKLEEATYQLEETTEELEKTTEAMGKFEEAMESMATIEDFKAAFSKLMIDDDDDA